jgi:hypothetical protein
MGRRNSTPSPNNNEKLQQTLSGEPEFLSPSIKNEVACLLFTFRDIKKSNKSSRFK